MDQRLQFIDDFGAVYEASGGGRMVGRVLGLLLTANPPRQSAEDIAETLHASRGSVSQATRLLVRIGLVRRIRQPGERRDYFVARADGWTETTRHSMREIDRIISLLERGNSLVKDLPPPDKEPILESLAFMNYWKQRMTEVFADWERDREQVLNELRHSNA